MWRPCGQGEEKTNPVKAATADPLNDGEVEKALLTLDDLPSGFTVDPELTKDEEDDPITEGSAECKELMDGLDDKSKGDAVGEAEIGFSEGDLGPFVLENVASFKGQQAQRGMDRLAKAFAACKSFTTKSSDGSETDFKVAPMSFAKLGDETVAVKVSAHDSTIGMTLGMSFVVVRTGQNIVLMANTGVPSAMPGRDFEKVTRTAVQRVSDAS